MQPNKKIVKNGCKQTSKESRGGNTSRTQEKGKAQLRWEDCVRRDMIISGEDDNGEGAADRKPWKERTERVARQYFT